MSEEMCKWNFQNYIALPLAEYAKREFPYAQYSADEIALGQFVDVMFGILRNKKITDSSFEKQCEPFRGKTASQISDEDAKRLFAEFCNLSGYPYVK